MSTDLTREQACDKFIKQKMRDGAGGLNRIISRAAFEAGWDSRDAEIARLTAENAALRAALAPVDAAAAYKVRFWEDDWNPMYHFEVALTVAECRAIRDALNPTEPSDA